MKRLSRVSAALLALLLLCGLLPPAPAAGGTPAPETTLSISTARELVQLSRDCTLDTAGCPWTCPSPPASWAE